MTVTIEYLRQLFGEKDWFIDYIQNSIRYKRDIKLIKVYEDLPNNRKGFFLVHGEEKLVEYILQSGVDVNISYYISWNALIDAVILNKYNRVKLLLKHGATWNKHNKLKEFDMDDNIKNILILNKIEVPFFKNNLNTKGEKNDKKS